MQQSRQKIKVLELFAGIGAFSKALTNLGIEHEIVDAVEIDKYAMKSFNAIHGTNFEPQDITKWDKDIEVDIIMHGSPCQSFSLAGKQDGGDKGSGTRSSLMWETVRIVEKLKPKYVIWENVKNLLSKKHRHNFDAYLEVMEQMGYKNYYQVLNAKDYGIPQNRERVFTISIRKDIEISEKIKPSVKENFEKEKEEIAKSNKEIYQCDCDSGWQDNKVGIKICPTIRANNNNTFILDDNIKFQFPPKQELKLKLKDMLEEEVDEKYYLSDKAINYVLDMNDVQIGTKWEGSTKNGSINKPIAMTIGCRSASCQRAGITNYIVDNEENEITVQEAKLRIKNATKKGYLEANEGDGVDISSRMQHHRGTVQKEMIQTLDCQGGNNKGVVIKKETDNYIEWSEEGKFDSDCRAYKEEKISGTIMTTPKNKILTLGNYMPSNHDASRVVDNDGIAPTIKENHGTVTATNTSQLRIRKLTPKECWRLMGFDDSDFDKAQATGMSNAQLYKQAGNSIVVKVLEEILKELL